MYQSLYHGNEGLFRRAIAMSGTLYPPGTYPPKNDAQRLGHVVGCEQTDSEELVPCLQSITAELLEATRNNYTSGLYSPPFRPFRPSKDRTRFTNFTKELHHDNRGREVFSEMDFMAGECVVEAAAMLRPQLLGK